VGIITDTTGVVADYGRHLLMGVSDYLKYINEREEYTEEKLILSMKMTNTKFLWPLLPLRS